MYCQAKQQLVALLIEAVNKAARFPPVVFFFLRALHHQRDEKLDLIEAVPLHDFVKVRHFAQATLVLSPPFLPSKQVYSAGGVLSLRD